MSNNEDWSKAVEVNAQNNGTWDMKEPLVGTYTSTQENVGPNNSQMHTVRNDDGDNIGAWGSTVLDAKMAEVPVGSRVKIEYLGLVKNPKSNREYKDFSVYMKPAMEGEKIELTEDPFSKK